MYQVTSVYRSPSLTVSGEAQLIKAFMEWIGPQGIPHQPPNKVSRMQMIRLLPDTSKGSIELLLVKVIIRTDVQKVYRTSIVLQV